MFSLYANLATKEPVTLDACCTYVHKGDTKEATYHPSLRAKRESEGVALGSGHWPPISAATQARQTIKARKARKARKEGKQGRQGKQASKARQARQGRQAEVKLLQPFADKNTGHTDTH